MPVAGSTWTTGLSAPSGLVDKDRRCEAFRVASWKTAKLMLPKKEEEEEEEEKEEEEEARLVEKP